MEAFIEILSAVFLITGSCFAIIGGIGLFRLPDFYTRVHAVGVTDTMGAGLVLLGCGLHSGFTLVTVKLFTVWLFIYITGPAATHALAKAAYAHGIKVDVEREDRTNGVA